jgi:hypothetical protein
MNMSQSSVNARGLKIIVSYNLLKNALVSVYVTGLFPLIVQEENCSSTSEFQ